MNSKNKNNENLENNQYNSEKDQINYETYKQMNMSDRLGFLENYLADNLLSDDLKLIYAKMQIDLGEFRENVFYKTLDQVEKNSGKYEKDILKGDDQHFKNLFQI